MIILSHEVIPCDGNVTTWDLWTRQPGKLRAMIVRPGLTTTEFSRYTIVGINDITITSAMANQKITYTVPSDERIIAQNGDMIAVVAFDGTNNPKLQATSSEGIVFEFRSFSADSCYPGITVVTRQTFEATLSLSVAISTE